MLCGTEQRIIQLPLNLKIYSKDCLISYPVISQGGSTGTLLFTMGQRTATDEIHFQPHEVQRHWLEWCVCVFIQEHVDLMSVRRLAQYGSDASR